MGTFLTTSDFTPFGVTDTAKVTAMIEDVEASAMLLAPCLDGLDGSSPEFKAVKAILRGVILRWNDAGSGGIKSTQQGAGPYQQTVTIDNSKVRRGAFWPSEIQQLQGICESRRAPGAFEVDTAPVGAGAGDSDRDWTSPTTWQPGL